MNFFNNAKKIKYEYIQYAMKLSTLQKSSQRSINRFFIKEIIQRKYYNAEYTERKKYEGKKKSIYNSHRDVRKLRF